MVLSVNSDLKPPSLFEALNGGWDGTAILAQLGSIRSRFFRVQYYKCATPWLLQKALWPLRENSLKRDTEFEHEVRLHILMRLDPADINDG